MTWNAVRRCSLYRSDGVILSIYSGAGYDSYLHRSRYRKRVEDDIPSCERTLRIQHSELFVDKMKFLNHCRSPNQLQIL